MNLQTATSNQHIKEYTLQFQKHSRMDSFSLHFKASKLDKAYVKPRHKKKLIYKLVHFVRVTEIFLISVFIWRNIPAAPQFLWINVKFNRKYLHEVLMLLSSPRTVFLIGNAIVLILLAKSRLRQNMSSDNASKPNADVYDEYIQIKSGGGDGQVKNSEKVAKSYKRSKWDTSPKMQRTKKEKAEPRRSATETKDGCRQLSLITVDEEAVCGKGMSDDEFRDMVEAFIARQQRNLRLES